MTAENPDLLDRLIAIRKWRGLTQHYVADHIPIARPAVSMIEARQRGCRVEFLEAYARAVGAEIGAWPIPIPEPAEVKRPPVTPGGAGCGGRLSWPFGHTLTLNGSPDE